MTVMDVVINYIVPVVSGVFVLIFFSIFAYILHRAVLKPLGVYKMIKNIIMASQRKKLLKDEKIIEYCVNRIEQGWIEPQVREELLLANKYTPSRIDQVCYVYDVIKKTMQGGKEKKIAQDLP